MKIAAAQIKPIAQNTDANIRTHLRMIDIAAQHQVQLIVFPEMSLTGYERELANELSFTENDSRLGIFCIKAKEHKMLIIAGAPIRIGRLLYIGSFMFTPEGTIRMYTKQYLHTGEEQFFAPSFVYNPLFGYGGKKISMAICADITNPLHPAAAAILDTSLYAASIFYSHKGIGKAYEQLGGYAKQYKMQVLMANYVGNSYEIESAGGSAYWNAKGELIGQLGSSEEALLIISTDEKVTHLNTNT